MNYLSRYLYSFRISNGYDSISDYYKAKKMPISEVYYRALEAGKHQGKGLMMDTAVGLCKALNADERQFFLHLLKDSLPDHLFTELVRPIPLESFGDLAERQRLLEHDLEIYKKNVAHARIAASYIPDNTIVTLLLKHPQWLAFVHFIYMVAEASEADLEQIRRMNHIKDDLKTVLMAFERCKIIKPMEMDEKTKLLRVKRFLPCFRLPLTHEAQKLKEEFLRQEMERSFEKGKSPHFFDDQKSFVESMIDAFSKEGCVRIQSRISDLLAEINASSESAGDSKSEASPYFFCLVISPRPEYMSDPFKQCQKLTK